MDVMSATMLACPKVMEQFNFEKVRALMLVNRWTYRSEKEAPTIAELESVVGQLFYTMGNSSRPNNKVSTGGFILTRFVWDSAIEHQLVFQWESTSTSASLE